MCPALWRIALHPGTPRARACCSSAPSRTTGASAPRWPPWSCSTAWWPPPAAARPSRRPLQVGAALAGLTLRLIDGAGSRFSAAIPLSATCSACRHLPPRRREGRADLHPFGAEGGTDRHRSAGGLPDRRHRAGGAALMTGGEAVCVARRDAEWMQCTVGVHLPAKLHCCCLLACLHALRHVERNAQVERGKSSPPDGGGGAAGGQLNSGCAGLSVKPDDHNARECILALTTARASPQPAACRPAAPPARQPFTVAAAVC